MRILYRCLKISIYWKIKTYLMHSVWSFGENFLTMHNQNYFRSIFQYKSSLYDIETRNHYNDVIMSTMASQITSLTIVYSSIYSGAHQRKHQSSASLAFVRGIHRGPVNSPHKWLVTRKMFPFDDVILTTINYICFHLGRLVHVISCDIASLNWYISFLQIYLKRQKHIVSLSFQILYRIASCNCIAMIALNHTAMSVIT